MTIRDFVALRRDIHQHPELGYEEFRTSELVAERLARLSEPDLPDKAIRYTRQVTIAWSVFFLCNGVLAAALTLWAPLAWWTLYNGLISYLLMGLLFAVEWLVRQRVRGQG